MFSEKKLTYSRNQTAGRLSEQLQIGLTVIAKKQPVIGLPPVSPLSPHLSSHLSPLMPYKRCYRSMECHPSRPIQPLHLKKPFF